MPNASSSPNTPPEAPTNGANGKSQLSDNQMHERSANHAQEVVHGVAPRSKQPLDFAAEHVQPNMLKKMCMSVSGLCKNPYVTSCQM